MRVHVVGLLLVPSLLASSLTAQADPSRAAKVDLPVKSVVLFSSGVGFFEHAGSVRGDGSTELRFKTAQINDVLKSLVLQDQDGGRVGTITYASQDPISKTLRSFQVDITDNPGMASLLNQLRGAKVTVQVPGDRLSGTVVGVEVRRKPVDKGESVDAQVLNLLSGAMIRSIDLASITSLSLDDPQLQDELAKALAALGQARDQDKKPVTINFTGSGERRVRIGYVVETPIWKTSYRLILDEKGARLQGWAIVENQTESDWNDVSLSLVSGRPVSFIMDLYQPLYLQRPTVVPELFAGLRPQQYQAGVEGGVARLPAAPAGGGGRGGALVPRDQVTSRQSIPTNAFEDASITTGASSSEFTNSSIRNLATAARLGELFQYAIPHVTLARQKSAMLPIVTDTVSVTRLSIYNATVLPRNPLNGVRLKNTTGKHFQQGPVTVLDANSYAGDARIDDVPPGQERLLSYGIDLDLVVDNTRNNQAASVVTAKVVKGTLLVDRKFVSSQDYQVDNKGTRDKTVVIEHPLRQGFKLAEGLKPVETTPTLYRFQLNAPAGKVTVLAVKEENVRQETLSMLPSDIGQLLSYSRTGEIPQAVRDALTKAIQMKQALLDLDAQITDRGRQVSDITSEQERIRENMKTVEPKSPYYDRLLAKLNEQESAIERLQNERDGLELRRDSQRKALEDYLNGLTVG